MLQQRGSFGLHFGGSGARKSTILLKRSNSAAWPPEWPQGRAGAWAQNTNFCYFGVPEAAEWRELSLTVCTSRGGAQFPESETSSRDRLGDPRIHYLLEVAAIATPRQGRPSCFSSVAHFGSISGDREIVVKGTRLTLLCETTGVLVGTKDSRAPGHRKPTFAILGSLKLPSGANSR